MHRDDCLSAEWDDALLVAFAVANDVAFLEMHVATLERGQFRNACAGRVQQFQNCPITQPPRVGFFRRVQQGRHLFFRQHVGHTLP